GLLPAGEERSGDFQSTDCRAMASLGSVSHIAIHACGGRKTLLSAARLAPVYRRFLRFATPSRPRLPTAWGTENLSGTRPGAIQQRTRWQHLSCDTLWTRSLR